MFLDTSDESLYVDSSSDESQKVLVYVGSSSVNVWNVGSGLAVHKATPLFRRHVWRQSFDALRWLHDKPPSLERKG